MNTQSDDVRLSDNKDDICIPFSCPTTIMIMNNNSINCERKEPEIKTRIVWHMKNERAGGKGKGKKNEKIKLHKKREIKKTDKEGAGTMQTRQGRATLDLRGPEKMAVSRSARDVRILLRNWDTHFF